MPDVPPGVKGMNDALPPDIAKWQFVEEKARGVLEAFAYRELRTPVLEYTPLFVRSVGEVTDVVEKQMYTFDDRDGRSVSLRPEGTASAVRAYIENAQWNKEPVTRWFYLGPMFRHERAQRGRLRQFHQIGAEWFGVNEPSGDAETIAMLALMLEEIGIPKDALTVTLNSLGEPEERAAYRDALVAFYRQHLEVLDEDSRRRLEQNPLRILDSKSPEIVALNAKAPVLLETLSAASQARFATVRKLLDELGVRHTLDTRLVRGLDYYTATIFEIKTTAGELGAQNTICGGGRYDGLVASLGGPKTP
ncbi:MAG TPA: histidine--tRNA ligase, partial [Polyangia bacterium]